MKRQTIDNSITMRNDPLSGGNTQVGPWLREHVRCYEDEVLYVKGPRINNYHHQDYDSFKPRYSSGLDQQFGVSALYNLDSSSWVTDEVVDIQENGKKIICSAVEGEEYLVYYYALPTMTGGNRKGFLTGSDIAQEHFDIPLRVYNDSIPMTWGTFDRTIATDVDWKWKEDMIYSSEPVLDPSSGWNTLIDINGATGAIDTGTCQNVETNAGTDYPYMPIYATEIMFQWYNLDDEYIVPKYMDVQVIVDGKNLTKAHGSGDDFIRFRPLEEDGTGMTEGEKAPGLPCDPEGTDYPHTHLGIYQMVVDYSGAETEVAAAKIDAEFEILESIEIKVKYYVYTENITYLPTQFDTYIRGWSGFHS